MKKIVKAKSQGLKVVGNSTNMCDYLRIDSDTRILFMRFFCKHNAWHCKLRHPDMAAYEWPVKQTWVVVVHDRQWWSMAQNMWEGLWYDGMVTVVHTVLYYVAKSVHHLMKDKLHDSRTHCWIQLHQQGINPPTWEFYVECLQHRILVVRKGARMFAAVSSTNQPHGGVLRRQELTNSS